MTDELIPDPGKHRDPVYREGYLDGWKALHARFQRFADQARADNQPNEVVVTTQAYADDVHKLIVAYEFAENGQVEEGMLDGRQGG